MAAMRQAREDSCTYLAVVYYDHQCGCNVSVDPLELLMQFFRALEDVELHLGGIVSILNMPWNDR